MAGGGVVTHPKYGGRYIDTADGQKLLVFDKGGPKLLDPGSEATADAGGFFKNAAAGALGSIVPGGNLIAKGAQNIAKSDALPPPMVPAEAPPSAPPASPEPRPQAAPPQAAPPGPTQGGPPPQQAAPQTGPLGYSMPTKVGGRTVEGEAMMTPEGVRVYVPGTKGTPGGLTGLGEQTLGQMTATERKIAEAREIEARGREAGAMAAIEEVAAQRAYQDEREVQAFAQAQEIDSEIQDIERKKQEKEIEFAKAKTMFTESRVDPDRYMKGNWLATLSMAFGAVGAALGKHANFAQEFVQNRINADIRAQELAIDLKGKNADNALADLNKTLGNLVDAKTAYKQFMTEAAAAKFSAMALRTQDKQLAAKYQEAAGQLMGLYAQQDQERKIKNQEKIWGEKMYYRQGTAGTTGGLFVPTQESYGTLSEQGRQNEELRLRQAADAKAAKAGGPGNVSASVAQQLTDVDAAQSGLRKMMEYHTKKEKPGVFTTGVLASEESQRLSADVESLAPIIGRGLEGNAPNEGTMKAIREGMLSASGDKIATSASAYYRQLEEKKRALLKQAAQGAPPGAPEP